MRRDAEALRSFGAEAWAFLTQEATPWKTPLLDPLTRYNAIAFPRFRLRFVISLGCGDRRSFFR